VDVTEPGQSPLGNAGDKPWAAARLLLDELSVVSFKAYFNSVIGAYRPPFTVLPDAELNIA